ncbi:hypothetical protein [Prolixibacter sp. SD074]|jgi:hypothetical protein|uniref:hypothetical protein n=1 Tax=Prolixibacter sp. SD074 TaxID=2652391 RepID=UPI001298FC95|nr:hypothetical protein [Prolixibacter sp. SD074]
MVQGSPLGVVDAPKCIQVNERHDGSSLPLPFSTKFLLISLSVENRELNIS